MMRRIKRLRRRAAQLQNNQAGPVLDIVVREIDGDVFFTSRVDYSGGVDQDPVVVEKWSE